MLHAATMHSVPGTPEVLSMLLLVAHDMMTSEVTSSYPCPCVLLPTLASWPHTKTPPVSPCLANVLTDSLIHTDVCPFIRPAPLWGRQHPSKKRKDLLPPLRPYNLTGRGYRTTKPLSRVTEACVSYSEDLTETEGRLTRWVLGDKVAGSRHQMEGAKNLCGSPATKHSALGQRWPS